MATDRLKGHPYAHRPSESSSATWADIDLNQPWTLPWAPWIAPGLPLLRAGLSVAEVMMNMAGNTCASDRPFCFVSQDELPSGEAYEAYISRTKRIPTRNNLHDLFNAACWLRFPAIKRRLNDLQSAELVRLGVGSTRGPVRDALTLFDENAILVSGPAPLRDALLVRDWHALFVRHRPLWSQTRMTVFGHALLEKLVRPYKSITAHALWVDTEPADLGMSIESWDTQLERSLPWRLTPELLASKPFCPLPVMGLPGWCAQNEAPDFYLDTEVFRPARR